MPPDVALIWDGVSTTVFEKTEEKQLQKDFYPLEEEKTIEIQAAYGTFAVILADTKDKIGESNLIYTIERIGDIQNPPILVDLNASDTMGAAFAPDDKYPYLTISTGTGDIPVETLEEYFETGEQMRNAGATEGSAVTLSVPPNSKVELLWQLVSPKDRTEQDGFYLAIDGELTLLGVKDANATYETSKTVISSVATSTFDVGESGKFSLVVLDRGETKYGTTKARIHRASYKVAEEATEPAATEPAATETAATEPATETAATETAATEPSS